MLAVRRRFSAFGRGTLRFLYPNNRKVLAYLREIDGERILCVVNVSRAPQALAHDVIKLQPWEWGQYISYISSMH